MRLSTPILAAGLLLLHAPAAFGGDYSEEVLDNGLRVVTIVRPEVPMVTLTTIVGAGSALEEADFSGASHFLEHLLFNGTSTMSLEELYAKVDLIGGYNNAHTDDDHTYYVLLVPSEHLATGLEVQAAMLFDSVLPEGQFEKERKIVLEEIAKDRSQPDHEVTTAIRERLWWGSPWQRPVIGTYDSLAGIERDRVVDYYRRQYVPGNMVLLVVGDFDREQAMAWVRATYGQPRDGEVPEVPDPWTRRGRVDRIRIDGAQPRVTLALPAPGICEDGGREAEVLAELLAGASGPLRAHFGDRLKDLLAYVENRRRGSSLRIDLVLTPGEDASQALEELLEVLARVGGEGLSAPGIDATSVVRVARAKSSTQLLMAQRLHYLGMILADPVASCVGSPRSVLTLGGGVVPEEVASVAAGIFGDVSRQGTAVVVGGAEELGAPMPVVEVAARAVAGSMRAVAGADLDRTLDNGLRVLVKQEKGAQVTGFHVLIRGRSAREPEGREGIADLAHRMLMEGTALSDRPRLEERLQRIGAELKTADSDYIPYDDYYTSTDHSFVRLEVPTANWLPALDLLAELLRTATLPEDRLGPVLEGRLARAEKLEASPSEMGGRLYARALLGEGSPFAHRVTGTPGSLAGITRDELLSFAQEYFDVSGMIVSVVTSEPSEDVLGAVRERFASAGSKSVNVPSTSWPVTEAEQAPVRLALGADQSRLYFGRIAAASPEERGGLLLLSATLSDRMAMTLREKEGLAYRLGASVAFAPDPDLAWLTASIGTRSENLEAAEEGIRREMALLTREAVAEAELAKIRESVRSRSLMRRMTAINRARYLGLRAHRGVPSAEDPDLLDAMDAVSPEELLRLAGKWLDPSTFQIVVLE